MTNRELVSSFHRDPHVRVEQRFELEADFSPEDSIVDRFNAVVRRFPSRLAIRDVAASVTYAELAVSVDRISAAIVAASKGSPGPVALLLAANANLPAAMLGVLAAGRPYIALDPDFPGERNALIVSQSGACAVISSADLFEAARTCFPSELPVIDIQVLSGAPQPRPDVTPRPDDLAAIYYTSGSSGPPKGVAWSHRNIVHWIQVFTDTAQISCADRMLLLSASVSASFRTIYSALLNGTTLHILPPLGLGLAALVQQIRERGITIYHSVPTLMRRIAESLAADERIDTVRVACIGGERVQWSDVDRCNRAFSRDVRVYSVLTSTEAGPFVHGFIDDALRDTTAHPPAGLPAHGWSVTIVDDDGDPVAGTETGEIVVTSRFIALGYWRGSDFAVEPFPSDPADPRLRIYKTGDLASRRHDGLIEFVGRKDQRIKLNGQRIELDEVESTLKHCAGVRDAAVVVRRDESGLPRQLVAYCELEPETTGVLPLHLSAGMAKTLPRYMVPSSITILDALPRLVNFKIDREELNRRDKLAGASTLPAPAGSRAEPSNKIQETLLGLWRDVLKRQDIDCDGDFFLLGGDSLSAVDLIHRIEEKLQYRVPFNILMESPTVRELDGRLETRTLGAINDTIRIHTSGAQRPLFAVSGSGGHGLRVSTVLRSLGPDQPCYGLQPPGMDWSSAGCETLPEMAAHYIGMVQTEQRHGPYRLLGTSFGGLMAFEMALQLQEMGELVEFLGMVDTEPPTCLEGGVPDNAPLPAMQHPQHQSPIEAINLRVAETHFRASRRYALDDRLERNLLRGELTYFYCTGNPVIAGRDRRPLWRRFAPGGFRLLPLPGLHGTYSQEPQLTALQNLLLACLDGKPPAASDPAAVFGRRFRIEDDGQRARILSSTGEAYYVEQDRIQGYVDTFKAEAELVRFAGWAVEHDEQRSAQTIAVFLDDQFLGYGASGVSRPDVAKLLGARSPQYAGFNLQFQRVAPARALERPRLFVLSSDGRAAELRTTLRAKDQQLQAELDAIKNSTCWRITRPLREIHRITAGILGRCRGRGL